MSEMFQATTFLQLKNELSHLMGDVREISIYLVFPIFVFSLVYEQVRNVDETPNYLRIVIQLLFFFLALSIYEPVFTYTHQAASNIAERIFSESEFKDFVREIWQGMAGDKDQSLWSMLRGGLALGIMTASYFFAGASFYFLDLIRNVLLGFLYVVGPFWLAIGILPRKANSMYRFFETVIVVNSWVIVANILMKIQSIAARAFYHSTDMNVIPIIASNIALGVMILFTPKITSLLASGEGWGSAGEVVGAAVNKVRDLLLVTAVMSRMKNVGANIISSPFRSAWDTATKPKREKKREPRSGDQ